MTTEFCTMCDVIEVSDDFQLVKKLTNGRKLIVDGGRAHVLLTGKFRAKAVAKFQNGGRPEAEVVWIHPAKPEPVPEEALDVLSSPVEPSLPQEPEPPWTPDDDIFYEVEIVRHNNVGMTGKLSNNALVFINSKVTNNEFYPPGSKLALRIRVSGPDEIINYHARELWREPEPEISTATLGDIYEKFGK